MTTQEMMNLIMALLQHVTQALAEGRTTIEISEIGDQHRQALKEAEEALKKLKEKQ